jgi:hypothetical protein
LCKPQAINQLSCCAIKDDTREVSVSAGSVLRTSKLAFFVIARIGEKPNKGRNR